MCGARRLAVTHCRQRCHHSCFEIDSYESNLIDVVGTLLHRLAPTAADEVAAGRARLVRKLGFLSGSFGVDLGKVFKPSDEVYGGGYFEARIMKEYGASAHLR